MTRRSRESGLFLQSEIANKTSSQVEWNFTSPSSGLSSPGFGLARLKYRRTANSDWVIGTAHCQNLSTPGRDRSATDHTSSSYEQDSMRFLRSGYNARGSTSDRMLHALMGRPLQTLCIGLMVSRLCSPKWILFGIFNKF